MYGLDVDDDAVMGTRSWRWLRARVLSLLDRPPQFIPYMRGPAGQQVQRFALAPSTRLGYALSPPDFSEPDSPQH